MGSRVATGSSGVKRMPPRQHAGRDGDDGRTGAQGAEIALRHHVRTVPAQVADGAVQADRQALGQAGDDGADATLRQQVGAGEVGGEEVGHLQKPLALMSFG